MICCKQSCRSILRSANVLNNFTSSERRPLSGKVKFFTKILEFPNSSATSQFLQKNVCVRDMDQTDVFNSFKYLTQIGITTTDIRKQPKILCVKHTALRNRHEILNECGCTTANIYFLLKYASICIEPEFSLKKVGIIGNDIDMQQRLADCLNVKRLNRCPEDKSLMMVRMHILRTFFMQNNIVSSMTAGEFDTTISQHVRHKSFRWTKAIVDILTHKFNIPADKIKDNFHMFQADPDNLLGLLSIGEIGGLPMTEVIRNTPALILKPYEIVVDTLAQLKKSGIGDDSIKKCFRVLTLDSKTVRSRISEFKSSNKELLAMNFHPSVLRLIVNKFKVQSRVDHLNELDKKCYNISALTGSLDNFQRFSVTENDKHMARDCALFLAKSLQMETETVKCQFSRHPYWLYVPFAEIKQTIETLKRAGFRLTVICANMHIVLYSGDLVLNRLKALNETEQIDSHNTASLSKTMQLKLVLYQIESELHFSGDGVWLDRKSNLSFE